MNYTRYAVALIALLLSACAGPPKNTGMIAATVTKKPKPKDSWWNAEAAGTGPTKIVISLAGQRAYFYRGEHVIGEANISTGKQGFDTPPGMYKITQKDENHVSNLYGNFIDAEGNIVKKDVDMSKEPDGVPEGLTFEGAKMPFFLRFSEGYGLHAGRIPGYRASHGCIRMPSFMAKHFFEAAEERTPVVVED